MRSASGSKDRDERSRARWRLGGEGISAGRAARAARCPTDATSRASGRDTGTSASEADSGEALGSSPARTTREPNPESERESGSNSKSMSESKSKSESKSESEPEPE